MATIPRLGLHGVLKITHPRQLSKHAGEVELHASCDFAAPFAMGKQIFATNGQFEVSVSAWQK
jgi:hypothetical protein